MNPKKRLSKGLIVLLSFLSVLVILLVCVAVFALLPSSSKANDLSAKLSEIAGVVQVKNSDQNQYNPVDDGFLLKTKMDLQTKEESRVRLDLSAGSIIRLGPLTIFSLDQQQSSSQGPLSNIALQAGRVWIILKGGSLDVNTPAGLASVRGSYMSVWVNPNNNSIEVCCLEGQCGYTNSAGNVDMKSGQKIVSSNIKVLPPVQKMDQTDVQSWLDNSPESVAMVQQIASIVATSTPSLTNTATITLTPTLTITSTPTPSPTVTMTITPSRTYAPLFTATRAPTKIRPTAAKTPILTPTYQEVPYYTPTSRLTFSTEIFRRTLIPFPSTPTPTQGNIIY
ncbi:MAG: FecR domain-containing protein [Anaerolineaceae bacterium]|nr:FecR domain-containing protein [Anaerolineaceae bacterium]